MTTKWTLAIGTPVRTFGEDGVYGTIRGAALTLQHDCEDLNDCEHQHYIIDRGTEAYEIELDDGTVDTYDYSDLIDLTNPQLAYQVGTIVTPYRGKTRMGGERIVGVVISPPAFSGKNIYVNVFWISEDRGAFMCNESAGDLYRREALEPGGDVPINTVDLAITLWRLTSGIHQAPETA